MATDLDKLKEMAEDTVTHKKLVLDNCLLISRYLLSKRRIELATKLMSRGCEHDNSKFEPEEFRRMAQILNGRQCFTDANVQLSPEEVKAIKHHWEGNRHHPEFFDNSDDMTELDVIEMVCDWFARSIQYGTDFIPFVKERQENRFKFSKKKFAEVMKWCELIVQLYNEDFDEHIEAEESYNENSELSEYKEVERSEVTYAD